MFEIGWTEILVIAIVAIVVFPSKDLPKLLRTTGQMVGRVRRMAGEFQSQFNAALREAEREVDLEDTAKQIRDLKSLNPADQVRKALDPLRSAGEDIRKELSKPGPSTSAPSQLVPPPVPAPAPSADAAPAAPVAVPPPVVTPEEPVIPVATESVPTEPEPVRTPPAGGAPS